MPYALNFYRDQICADGATTAPLAAAHRLVYVRHGRAVINGQTMLRDQAAYVDGPVTLAASGEWSEIWRWDLCFPNAAPLVLQGNGVLSGLRMSRVIASIPMIAGGQWLFRLDRIISAAGRMADRHQHPGPGIRCLVEGTFNVQQDAESMRDAMPGDAWWETGTDTVIAWGSPQMAAVFMRGMVVPAEWEGKPTGVWLSGQQATARGNWQLYVDRVITV